MIRIVCDSSIKVRAKNRSLLLASHFPLYLLLLCLIHILQEQQQYWVYFGLNEISLRNWNQESRETPFQRIKNKAGGLLLRRVLSDIFAVANDRISSDSMSAYSANNSL